MTVSVRAENLVHIHQIAMVLEDTNMSLGVSDSGCWCSMASWYVCSTKHACVCGAEVIVKSHDITWVRATRSILDS